LLIEKINPMLKIYITLFVLFFFNLSAEIAQKLEVKGNNRISAETIRVYGDITIGKDYSAFDINQILKNLYDTDFFEDVEISLTDGVLDIFVKEYLYINFVDLEGEKSKSIKKTVLERLKLKQKESFIESKLSQDINLIKKMYATMGFNFVNVEPKIKKFEDSQINLLYIVDKGKKTNISKIYFAGDKKIKDKRLRDLIVSEEKKFWKVLSKNTFLSNTNIELDKRLLINYYKSVGYYDVQILSTNAELSQENSTSLTYTINAGTRYKINKISTNVSSVLDKKIFIPLQDNYTKIIGKYYSPFKVKKLLDELDLLIVNNDLQFIEHSVNEILEGDSIEIKINIFEGKKLLVEKINIIGNTVTDEAVIRAELSLDEGDPFNKLKLDQSLAKLNSRNIFSEVKSSLSDGSQKDQKIIDIKVEEKATGEISAGAGLGTNGGSFAFDIRENNWLGRGIAVTTSLSASKETFSGGLSVSDPNYKFSGNSLNYYIKNTTNDKPDSGFKNNIITAGIGTKFEQYNNIYISPRLSASFDQLKVESTASDTLKKQKGDFTDLSFGYGILLDERDKVYAPTDGYVSSFSQLLPIYADSPYIKNSYGFSKYQALTTDSVGTFKFHVAAINGLNDKDVRLSKRVNLTNRQLRGFESGKVGPKDGTRFVGGNYTMVSNFEINLPNILPEVTKTDVGLYLDVGNVWGVDYDQSLDSSNNIRSSTGILTNWISPIGPMSFVFSQNLSKSDTDITEAFSFNIGTTF
jgi:outer membrane protein insertion porin family